MKKKDTAYLKHILDAVSHIEEYIHDVRYKEFVDNPMLQAAVIRELEIIGEATKRLAEETKKRDESVPWKQMAGMRDKLIHDYFGVDLSAVWDTAREDIPSLKGEIRSLIK